MSGPVTAGVGARGTVETHAWLCFVLESVPSALVSPKEKFQPFVARKKNPFGSWVIKKNHQCLPSTLRYWL